MEFLNMGMTEQIIWAIAACLVMMFLDIVTGFTAAWKNNDIQSTRMREGLFHKAALVMLIVLAWLCEMFVMHVPELNITLPLVMPACVIIFAMEMVSITENISNIYPELKDTTLLKLFKSSAERSGEHAKRG